MFSFRRKSELWLPCINQDCQELFRAEDTCSSFCPACRWVFGLSAREQDDMLEFWERDIYAA